MVGIFLIIWGAIFAGVPVYLYMESLQGGGIAVPFVVVILFAVFGLVAFILGIYNLSFVLRRKFIAKIGNETVATFVDLQKSSTQKNGTDLYFIKYYYTDESGVRFERRTAPRFKFSQAYYFKNLKYFKIKYIGKNAVITEPLNFNVIAKLPQTEEESFTRKQTNITEQNASFNKQKSNFITQTGKISPQKNTTNTAPKITPIMGAKMRVLAGDNSEAPYSKPYNAKQYFTCDYCGYVQDEMGRCLSCGARIKPKR